ncbi:hypothetical protein HB774_34390 (plasmid) [Rhizobium leguminosarum bv. viciae]|nr:hypothetical protein HB774_34390 [Rhizobium leguminosarum bv. viciae]
MATFFNEFFGVTTDQLDDHGPFNISVTNDMPLFIDPFLLFNSKKPEYRQLHDDILRYMMFLRDAVIAGRITPDLEKAWFLFSEVKQEKQRLDGISDTLGILGHKDVVVIDARNDNKPSGSKAA